MANNLFANVPAACVAKQTISFASAGFNSSNCRIIYEVGNPLKSWVPDRGINAVTGFTAEKGYYIIPMVDLDMEAVLIPPVPTGGGASTPAAPTAGVVDDTADTFNWTNNPLYPDVADYEYTLNGGSTYANLTAKPLVVGDIAKAIGQVGVRVKAVGGDNASSTLYNATAFTVAGGGYDASAEAFFTAYTITDNTEKSVLDRLIRDLKGEANVNYTTFDLWTTSKVIAAYPFLGSAAAKTAGQLRNPGTFDITWFGNWTHNGMGVTPDGNPGTYATIGIVPSAQFSADSAYWGVYLRNDLAGGEKFPFGANDGSGGFFCKPRAAGGNFQGRINGGDVEDPVADTLGYFSASRLLANTPDAKIYKNGTYINGNDNPEYRTAQAIYLGCMNHNGGEYGNAAYNQAFLIFCSGLTDAENTFLNNAVLAFCTGLGRNV